MSQHYRRSITQGRGERIPPVQKIRFLRAIARDPRTTLLGLRIATIIVDMDGANDQHPYLSATWLATQLQASPRGVEKAISSESFRQWVEVMPRQGRRQTNVFRPRWERANTSQSGTRLRTGVRKDSELEFGVSTEPAFGRDYEGDYGDEKHPYSPQGDQGCSLSAEKESEPTRKTEDLMVAAWGEVLGDVLPKPRGMTSARKRALLARFTEDCKSDHKRWRVFLDMIRRSDFLCGRAKSDRPFKATLDWVLKPANFWKIVEGNYENRTSPRGPRFDTTG